MGLREFIKDILTTDRDSLSQFCEALCKVVLLVDGWERTWSASLELRQAQATATLSSVPDVTNDGQSTHS